MPEIEIPPPRRPRTHCRHMNTEAGVGRDRRAANFGGRRVAASAFQPPGPCGDLGRALLRARTLAGEKKSARFLTLVDQAYSRGRSPQDPRLEALAGDIFRPEVRRACESPRHRLGVHMAAVVSGAAEADFESRHCGSTSRHAQVLEQARRIATAGCATASLGVRQVGWRPSAASPEVLDDSTTPGPTDLLRHAEGDPANILVSDFFAQGLRRRQIAAPAYDSSCAPASRTPRLRLLGSAAGCASPETESPTNARFRPRPALCCFHRQGVEASSMRARTFQPRLAARTAW